MNVVALIGVRHGSVIKHAACFLDLRRIVGPKFVGKKLARVTVGLCGGSRGRVIGRILRSLNGTVKMKLRRGWRESAEHRQFPVRDPTDGSVDGGRVYALDIALRRLENFMQIEIVHCPT